MIIQRRCWVSGYVQGVFFRASTRKKMQELGLEGDAINLPDGRVQVRVRGEERPVRQLCDWLRTGPPAARVDDVQCEGL